MVNPEKMLDGVHTFGVGCIKVHVIPLRRETRGKSGVGKWEGLWDLFAWKKQLWKFESA